MGRSKKILTDYEYECRKRASKHIEALIKKESTTIKQLADDLGVEESTLRNYMKARTSMRPSIAQVFANKKGFIPAYWMGETDCETWKDYQEEHERARDEGEGAYYAELKRRQEELSKLFYRFGFSYTDISHTAKFDFQDFIANAPHIDPNIITSLSTPKLSASFTDEELQIIFDRMHDVVELAIYKKANKDALSD